MSIIEKITQNKINILRECKRNIEQYNPLVNAILSQIPIQFNEKREGILANVPIIIKDNIAIKGERLSACSRILSGYVSPYNATVVERIIKEGGLPIARANMDELAMGLYSNTGIYGKTRNPFQLKDKEIGGSSGGSACAVSCQMAPLSLGTDTGGSVRTPASLTGLVGIKPTYGSVSRFGLIPFAPSFDQIGILAHYAKDVQYLLEVISGHDKKDSSSLKESLPQSHLHNLKNLRCGIDRNYIINNVTSDEYLLIEDTLSFFKKNGVIIKDVLYPSLEEIKSCYRVLSRVEGLSSFAKFDGIRYGYSPWEKDHSLEAVVKHRSQFGAEVKRRLIYGEYFLCPENIEKFHLIQKLRSKIVYEIKTILQENDFILWPSVIERNNHLDDILSKLANISGYPAVSFPIGKIHNIPFGCTIMSNFMKDNFLLNIIDIYQQQEHHIFFPLSVSPLCL
jgi:aspartyl-tRNA(Asn)/glutamyl-tRNA(Gln) amidotransferase subunit A